MRAARLLVLACLSAFVLAGTAFADGTQTFVDMAGDSGAAADVTGVVVSNDTAGNITFVLTLANRTDVTLDDEIQIPLDTDLNSRTGDKGFDHVLEFHGADRTVDLGRWTGTRWDYDVPLGTLASTDGKTFIVNRTDLGRTRGFAFGVYAGLASDQNVFDAAPGDTLWRYELAGFPQIRIGYVSYPFPRAGSTFSLTKVELGLSDGTRVKPTTYSCTAKLAGKTLKLARRCAWRLPKSAKGKKLVVVISVAYDGQSGQIEPFGFRVR